MGKFYHNDCNGFKVGILCLNDTKRKRTLVRGKNGHHKLIDEGQKSLRHKKMNVTKGGIAESIGVVVTFKVHHQ